MLPVASTKVNILNCFRLMNFSSRDNWAWWKFIRSAGKKQDSSWF
jgi:hypothetical protein